MNKNKTKLGNHSLKLGNHALEALKIPKKLNPLNLGRADGNKDYPYQVDVSETPERGEYSKEVDFDELVRHLRKGNYSSKESFEIIYEWKDNGEKVSDVKTGSEIISENRDVT